VKTDTLHRLRDGSKGRGLRRRGLGGYDRRASWEVGRGAINAPSSTIRVGDGRCPSRDAAVSVVVVERSGETVEVLRIQSSGCVSECAMAAAVLVRIVQASLVSRCESRDRFGEAQLPGQRSGSSSEIRSRCGEAGGITLEEVGRS